MHIYIYIYIYIHVCRGGPTFSLVTDKQLTGVLCDWVPSHCLTPTKSHESWQNSIEYNMYIPGHLKPP